MRSRITVYQICSELRKQIVNRSLPPGSKLSENLLAKRWNVSRTPLREVLRLLEAEGLVTSDRFKGFTVNLLTLEDVEQLYPIRIYLEGLAGKLATPIITGDRERLKVLAKLCKEMEGLVKKKNVATYIAKNNEFHSYIWHACGNKWLTKILENLSSQVSRFIIKALYVPHRMDKSIGEHWEIYKRLQKGDANGVEKSIQNNHKRAFEDLKRELIQTK
jgi:DNA-binding GntR family transcriptional regulator